MWIFLSKILEKDLEVNVICTFKKIKTCVRNINKTPFMKSTFQLWFFPGCL